MKTIIKIFLISTSLLIFFVVASGNNSGNSRAKQIAWKLADDNGGKIYFVGSSRVKRSINEQLLSAYFSDSVRNLGLTQGTFLTNLIVLEHLAKIQGEKIIFVELSMFSNKISSELTSASQEADINVLESVKTITDSYSFHRKLNIYSSTIDQLIHARSIRFREKVQELLTLNSSDMRKQLNQAVLSDSSFLKVTDCQIMKQVTFNSAVYWDQINRLNGLFQRSGSRMYFFLPTTFKSEKERQEVLNVFHQIPEEMKLIYSESFLEEITDSRYLLDPNHLNSEGAIKYSQLMIPLIEGCL